MPFPEDRMLKTHQVPSIQDAGQSNSYTIFNPGCLSVTYFVSLQSCKFDLILNVAIVMVISKQMLIMFTHNLSLTLSVVSLFITIIIIIIIERLQFKLIMYIETRKLFKVKLNYQQITTYPIA